MKYIIKKYITITISLALIIRLISAVVFSGNWNNFFYDSFTLTLLYFIGRPVANLVMLPINLLTLNLFSWIINLLLFYIWTILATSIRISAWEFQGLNLGPLVLSPFNFASWQVIIIASILLTFIIQIIDWIIK